MKENKMSDLEKLRHSTAHLLAAAVLKLWPKTKLGIGPVIEDGFYYDFDSDYIFTPEDFIIIEKTMKEIASKNSKFEKKLISIAEAKKQFKNDPYKLDLIKEFEKENKQLSFYKTGDFIDLCKGPHLESTKDIKFFKLLKLAAAYWRGDSNNKQLQRIYGTSFSTQKELDECLFLLEEAKKRDHRIIGKELGLFMFSETSPGMPYWLPNGLILYNELINFWREEHNKFNYKEIASPLLNKKELYEISGHWNHYKEHMFIADMGKNEIYCVKPMNCPNAMVVFKSMQVSYKDLPLRLSDTDRLHRYELSGTLNGLFRVRSFQQDDSHNFVSEDMINSEYKHIFEVCEKFYSIFNLQYYFRMGTRPEKFLGEIKTWDKAEKELKEILKESGKKFSILEGDGAFYGPKIDIIMKDTLNREWQMGTIQLDFQLPKRFDLKYTDKDGKDKTPIVIHRVIYGSLERFIGILIEHTIGKFPLWISPIQVCIITVADRHNEFANKLKLELVEQGIRVEVDCRTESIGKKVRDNQLQHINYIITIGDKEISTGELAVRTRDNKVTNIKKEQFIKELLDEIKNKK